METENWLHEYRKLEKEKDLMRFASSATTPWADSRLKFKRNFLHILQKLYLLIGPSECGFSTSRKRDFLALIDHLLKCNSAKPAWDICQSIQFLQLATYAFVHVMGNQIVF